MRYARLLLLTAFLLPAIAFAKEETVFDFRGNQLPGKWAVAGKDPPQGAAEGLLIKTTADWSMVGQTLLSHPAEAVSLTFVNLRPTEARLLWHVRGSPPGTFVQLPFIIPATDVPHTVDVNVDAYPQWDRNADQVGFALPAGAAVLLQDIRFSHWTPMEKMLEVGKSFWTFDHLGPYSINFIWGPIITFNPVGTQELFTTLPPRGRSANWIFYGVMALVGAGLLLHRLLTRHDIERVRMGSLPGHAAIFLLCFAALWVVYDIRMGLEFLTYARTDYATFISKPVGERQFRTYANFPDVAEMSKPYIEPKKSFAFLSPIQTPFISMMRYFAYPKIPIVPNKALDLRTWVVFDRNDVTVSSDGRLSIGDSPISLPGEIVKKIDDYSFIFQTHP